jgi:hypothetical protein
VHDERVLVPALVAGKPQVRQGLLPFLCARRGLAGGGLGPS